MKYEIMRRIEQLVTDKLGDDYKVDFKDVQKNNGVVLHSAVISKPGVTVVPNIYIDRFLEGLEAGTVEAEEVADYIVKSYTEAVKESPRFAGFASSIGKEYILENVTYQLVNMEKNENRLKEVPFKEMLDLAALYRVVIEESDEETASFVVSNEMCVIYGISIDELDAAAMKNTSERSEFRFRGIAEVIQELSGTQMDASEDEAPMYVITSKNGVNGATVLLYDHCLKLLADRIHNDLYILPSSIHEVLAVPCDDSFPVNVLRTMVKEVNATEVADDEILGDSVYKYSRQEQKLTIA